MGLKVPKGKIGRSRSMRYFSPPISSLLVTGCLSVSRGDGARTLAPGKIEIAFQAGIEDQDLLNTSSQGSCEVGGGCFAQDEAKKRKDTFAFSNGVVALQGQARLGLVDSLDAGIVFSPTGVGIDLKKNWLETETIAFATSVLGMTSIFSSAQSMGDSRMSSLLISFPAEVNFPVPNIQPAGVFIVAPLAGYYWKQWEDFLPGPAQPRRKESREDILSGAQAMVGVDWEVTSRYSLRLGLHAWYVQPRQIGDATIGSALGIGFRFL